MTNGKQERGTRGAPWVVGALVLALGCAGCKRVNEGEHPQTMNPASSEVMSNSAGVSGTPGQSDAADRAGSEAGASAPAPASADAPLTTTPPDAPNAPSSAARP